MIECKTSIEDFRRDRRKYVAYQDPESGYVHLPRWVTAKLAKDRGWKEITLPSMGDYRFYFCEPGVLSPELIEDRAPDHGLLIWEGQRIRMARIAPRRQTVCKDSEIRYLRFAIINRIGFQQLEGSAELANA